MSKLYGKYKNLKSENATKLYLFKSGIFYIFFWWGCNYNVKASKFKINKSKRNNR